MEKRREFLPVQAILRKTASVPKYTFVLLGQVACGAATWDEILPILQERERQRDEERRAPPPVVQKRNLSRSKPGLQSIPSRAAACAEHWPQEHTLNRSSHNPT